MVLSVLLSFFSLKVVSSPVRFWTQKANRGRCLVVYFPLIVRSEFAAHNVRQKQHCQQEWREIWVRKPFRLRNMWKCNLERGKERRTGHAFL